MSAHDDRSSDDELTRRYHEANAQDMSRPGAQVRLRVQQHARAALEARQQPAQPAANTPDTCREAANQPRWKMSLLASIALAGLTGLLVLQFDRGTPQDKDMAFGQPAVPAAPATSPPPAATAPTPPAPPPAPVAAKKAAPQASPQATRQPQDNRHADAATEAAAPSPGKLGSDRDTRQEREAATTFAAPSPSAFPASPPPMIAAPAPAFAPAPARAMAAPPEAATTAPTAAQKSGNAASSRARAAPGLAESITLLQAASAGRTADIERLLQQGAPINGTDDAGRTPLMLAALNGQEAAVRQLLGLGANRDLVDREGLTALAHARRRGLPGIAALLEAAR